MEVSYHRMPTATMASTPRLHEDSWPKLAKADTQVVLTRDHIYELPSDALRSRIGWFRQNLTDSTAAEITQENRSKARGSILWRVELDLAGKKGVQGLFVINVSPFLKPLFKTASNTATYIASRF